ncbi:acetate uptake transporter [Dongshaea marina]|uniref:acetate uptake transporter n=1 Tax=Dongshaea marina TaxID=2047966 RepID=UPI000D3E3EB1|nr:GPR1/FUN34/YaaH family transporter [Dongshaea marina]
MSTNKLGNPAVIGLGGFGMTTMVLQFHNLGWCGIAPVIWLGLVFGGGCQLLAGLMEFKKNNNFGCIAFTGYGAFWITFCLMLIFGTNSAVTQHYGVFQFTTQDLAFYLLVWAIFTLILFIGSMRQHTAIALVFLTLFLGFAGLSAHAFTGNALYGTLAAWDLLICAILAWYSMTQIVYADLGIKLPVGPAWITSSPMDQPESKAELSIA